MDLSKPYSAISPRLDLELLVELARSTQPRSGRELARRIERSWGGVRPALARLVEHGLLDRDEVGATYVYRLNREHLLAPAVDELAGARTTFFSRLRSLIAAWKIQPLHASIFGSMARGDGDTTSDVDVFVVRPKRVDLENETWRQQLDDLSDRVRTWTGNAASLIEVGSDELVELRRGRRPILAEIRSDAVDLAGRKARQVVGE
jgi:predicted nucleotidyltransferase